MLLQAIVRDLMLRMVSCDSYATCVTCPERKIYRDRKWRGGCQEVERDGGKRVVT